MYSDNNKKTKENKRLKKYFKKTKNNSRYSILNDWDGVNTAIYFKPLLYYCTLHYTTLHTIAASPWAGLLI